MQGKGAHAHTLTHGTINLLSPTQVTNFSFLHNAVSSYRQSTGPSMLLTFDSDQDTSGSHGFQGYACVTGRVSE
jgi:hypothetical protein